MARNANSVIASNVPRITAEDAKGKPGTDVSQVERILSTEESEKEHINYDRIDQEVAKYASTTAIEISGADNKRLKRMIDKRVLTVMVFTYFLQALDKGTMSFASIMHIRQDLGLHGQQVCFFA